MKTCDTSVWSLPRAETIGKVLLICSAALVGAAIATDGSIARLLNGLGAVGWFASIPLLVKATLRESPHRLVWLVCVGLSVVIAFLVRPSDLVQATIAFGLAGFTVGWVARARSTAWGALVAAFYLPAHVGAALSKVAFRALVGSEAVIRTEPPPTAAIVPLVIVVTAMTCAFVAPRLRSVAETSRPRTHSRADRRERT